MLEQFVIGEIFTFLLIFTRIGTGVMILPGFGEVYVSARIRLFFAMGIALLLTPVLGEKMPPMPDNTLMLTMLIISESMVGFFIGLISRIMISSTHIAGMMISYTSGLASANMFDTTQATQGSLIGNFLGLSALMLIFLTGLHHLMLMGVVESYALFPPGEFPPIGEFTEMATRIVGDIFIIAFKVASPHLAIGLALYMAAGVMGRLMPQMQVFFILLGPQIGLTMFVLIVVLDSIFRQSLGYYEEVWSTFIP
jgi:flagellar biosynthetic protein FliR